eukprot:scaffold4357_cov113-Isochrysis_galbana.AAC.11
MMYAPRPVPRHACQHLAYTARTALVARRCCAQPPRASGGWLVAVCGIYRVRCCSVRLRHMAWARAWGVSHDMRAHHGASWSRRRR